jgi:hypothetical protein
VELMAVRAVADKINESGRHQRGAINESGKRGKWSVAVNVVSRGINDEM